MTKYKKLGEGELKDLKKKLSPLQYQVTQESGTEQAFKNEYWDNKKEGIYVDVVSGEPLFSSKHKFDSGTGWPSFYKPLVKENVLEKEDWKFFMRRTEVRSKDGNSHLGHVFEDGPAPTGLRYCMNSAALRFIPKEKLQEEGFGEFFADFESEKSPAVNEGGQNETAILAGGCFWGVEDLLRKLPGVLEIYVGYTGGEVDNPKYELVKQGITGHAEAVKIVFDPKKISYDEILDFFFRLHDPTTLNRQGNDIGTQYRSAIFYENEKQKEAAQRAIEKAGTSGRWKKPVVTEIVPQKKFYMAEEYHQDYLQKHPGGYTCHFLRD